MYFPPDESSRAGGADRGSGAPQEPPAAAAEIFGGAFPLACRYAALLAGPGTERGLLGPAESGRLWDRHLLNSAAVAELLPPDGVLADLGSGAGLPGVVLALLRPAVRVVLVEPMLRRTEFLEECVRELGLANTVVLRGRAEDVAGQVDADVVTARAVAPLHRLAGMAAGLLRPGGLLLAVKGQSAAAELEQALPVLARLGLSGAEIVTVGGRYLCPAVTVVRMRAGRGAAQRGAGDARSGGKVTPRQ